MGLNKKIWSGPGVSHFRLNSGRAQLPLTRSAIGIDPSCLAPSNHLILNWFPYAFLWIGERCPRDPFMCSYRRGPIHHTSSCALKHERCEEAFRRPCHWPGREEPLADEWGRFSFYSLSLVLFLFFISERTVLLLLWFSLMMLVAHKM